MMHRRSLFAATLLSAPALAQPASSRTLRFMPQAGLVGLDPIMNPTTITTTHSYCVFDTLYGVNARLQPRPQMAEGHTVSADGLTWTIRLRDGLRFHDGAPVRSVDCVASLRRWAQRDGFGRILAETVAAWGTPDDRTLTIRLIRPFPALLDALAKPVATPAFIMPQRLAETPPERAITEIIGSGPWRWLPDQFVPAARAGYAKFEGYVPRDEAAESASGGKRVHFDRLELIWIPDPGTAVAALRTGEVDWVEYPLPDLVPILARERGISTQVYDPNGFLGFLRFNHLHAPFDKVALRQAIRDLIGASQADYMAAVALPGDGRDCRALFACGLPGVVEAPPPAVMRDPRAALRAAGYAGEKITIINPTDFAAIVPQGRITTDILRRAGVEVDLIEADWPTIVARRANKAPPAQGGWNIFHTNLPAAGTANPAVNPIIRANGEAAWFGWPTDAGIEAGVQSWLRAPDIAAQAAAFAEVQRAGWDAVPFAPTGQFVLRTAFRSDLTGVLQAPNPMLWNLRRGA